MTKRTKKNLIYYALGICITSMLALIIWSGGRWSESEESARGPSRKELQLLIQNIHEEISISEDLLQRVLSQNEAGKVDALARREVRQGLQGLHKDVAVFLQSDAFASRAADMKQGEPTSILVENAKLGSTSVVAEKTKPFRLSEELLSGNMPASYVSSIPGKIFNLREASSESTHIVPPAIIPDAVEFGERVKDSVLIVGGTDGSGTRRVVEVLALLGVNMVSEDPETLDVHADLVGGWPDIVRPVIQATRNTNYDHETALPWKIKKDTVHKVQDVLKLAKDDALRPQSKFLSVGGRLDTPRGVHAYGVAYGIKAPVSMTMVPSLHAAVPNLKFLHVVRDGRDIAFSTNLAPVEKFYYSMYGRREKNLSIRLQAIELWSDWNSGLFEWSINASKYPIWDHKYSYFLIHIEDLISESTTVQFAAMRKLADWVESNATDEYLCCLAVAGPSFLKQEDQGVWRKSSVKATSEVRKRYGKWRERTKMVSGLAESITEAGRRGLERLGYEPERALPAFNARTSSGFTCNLTPEDCGVEPTPPSPATCKYYPMTEYRGVPSPSSASALTKSLDDCCQLCADFGTTMCAFFTYDTSSKTCFFKQKKGDVVEGDSARHFISGYVQLDQ